MAPRKVLVIDDEPAIRELVQFNLERAGLTVISAADGEEALALFRSQHPDLLLLDLMLPRLDGFTVCRRIRDESTVPIIMLTARTAEQDRVEGLEMGADDYLIKPFSPRELVARVKAVLRRAEERPPEPVAAPSASPSGSILRHGPLLLDQERHEAFVDGQSVYLTPKEFALLAILMAHPGRVYSRETLLDQAWGYEFAGDTRTVDVHIRRLRQKVERDPAAPHLLETVHGLGYRLREKV
jgi:two-component system alkaline phosphatase synthesis response regulator PhoP